ncbi:L-rhamnose mutarotase [Flagellimonas sp. HMM57]|uniref:L-rhamnose mutarotase n=1 Tax=unclassified Flagellimonas TaxID=2644544 RepID=UPI0013D1E44B|nr:MULTISPECIES: L-rhamnose mutarotase [unclassified Flagellimonas]UII75362.1 L-rhamnose mutarotase [Flagellimonas sp. HMM57]
MSTNQFRRFTYCITAKKQGVSEILAQIKLEAIQKQLVTGGITAFEGYQKEDIYFLLIDGALDMNSRALADTLSSMVLFSDIQRVLQEDNTPFSFESSVLERIYKLDQKVIFRPEDGQLKTRVGVKKRFVLTLLLQDDPELIAEYKKVHGIGQAWPEITANMKSVGVMDMEIYLHNSQAFLIMDTIPNFDMDVIGPQWQQLPRETEWQEYVAKFQRIHPQDSIQEKWGNMLPI